MIKKPGPLSLVVLLITIAISAVASAHSPVQDQWDYIKQNTVKRIWWNQAGKVEEIELTEQQRADMDQLLAVYLETVQALDYKRMDAMQALGEALALGELDAARERREEIAGYLVDPVTLQIDMMIEVTALLSTRQRVRLLAKYPNLMSGLWVRSTRNRAGRVNRELSQIKKAEKRKARQEPREQHGHDAHDKEHHHD